MEKLPEDILRRIQEYLTDHEKSLLIKGECSKCKNFKHAITLDQDIGSEEIRKISINYCATEADIEKVKIYGRSLEHVHKTAQRIHIVGNHWPFIHYLSKRRFVYYTYSTYYSYCNTKLKKNNYCITDIDPYYVKYIDYPVKKINGKFIITQSSVHLEKIDYVDYLLIHFNKIRPIPKSKYTYLIIHVSTGEKFYTDVGN